MTCNLKMEYTNTPTRHCWIPSNAMKKGTVSASKRNSTLAPRPSHALAVATRAVGVSMAPCKLQCYSVACVDMPHLEFGDKIVLPSKVLLELQCLKIATPMIFQIRRFGEQQHGQEEPPCTQYCSVQEFSAPDGHVFIPYWMMQNLQLGEGDDVVLTNASNIARGIYCRLQPEDSKFLEIAAEIGPKLLMESALRRYSVLSTNETILIEYGNDRFYVKALELKPAAVVSLLGDVDLELDFVAPPATDVKRPRSPTDPAPEPQKKSADENQANVTDPIAKEQPGLKSVAPQAGLGRRLHDGSCVVDDSRAPCAPSTVKPPKPSMTSFKAAKDRIQSGTSLAPATASVAMKADSSSLATTIKQSQASFASAGHQLQAPRGIPQSLNEEGHSSTLTAVVTTASGRDIECDLCLAEVSTGNMDLHKMRCSRNPAYHQFRCGVCQAKVFKRDRESHIHCMQCEFLCSTDQELQSHTTAIHSQASCPDCGLSMLRSELPSHQTSTCARALELCTLCGFKVKRKDLVPHSYACASRTEHCDVCLKYIKIVDIDAHRAACISDSEARAAISPDLNSNPRDEVKTENPSTLTCAYCSKNGFTAERTLKRHIEQECLIARSFKAPTATAMSPQVGASMNDLVQGKIKRRADAARISKVASSSSPLSTAPLPASNQRGTSHQDSMRATHPLLQSNPLHSMPATSRTRSKEGAKGPVKQTHLQALTSRPPPPVLQEDPISALFIGSKKSTATRLPPTQHAGYKHNASGRNHRALP